MFLFRKKETNFKVPSFIEEISKDEIKQEIKNNKRVLILFYELYCPFCVKFIKYISDYKEVLKKHDIKIFGVSPDKYKLWVEDNDKVYKIKLIPTIIVYKDGKIVNRFENVREIKKLVEHLI